MNFLFVSVAAAFVLLFASMVRGDDIGYGGSINKAVYVPYPHPVSVPSYPSYSPASLYGSGYGGGNDGNGLFGLFTFLLIFMTLLAMGNTDDPNDRHSKKHHGFLFGLFG